MGVAQSLLTTLSHLFIQPGNQCLCSVSSPPALQPRAGVVTTGMVTWQSLPLPLGLRASAAPRDLCMDD